MATTTTNAQRLKEVEREHGLHADGNPALYVGTYRKYNEGSLYGAWLDLTSFDDYDDFMATCRYLHEDESDPELMSQDFMYFPESYYHEGWMDEETFDAIREFAELSEDEQEAYSVYCKYASAPTIENFRDNYCGEYHSIKDYLEYNDDEACMFLGLSYDEFDRLRSYIDFEAIAIELDIDGWLEKDGYVFRNAA